MRGVAAIIVTYNPDLQRLGMVLDALPVEVRVVVVDNNSAHEEVDEIERLLAVREDALLIRNASNAGLAAAINQGVAALEGEQVEFLLLMDQDSVPRPGALAVLHDAFLQLEADGQAVGCVGPRLMDSATGIEHGFHTMRGLRWVRVFPKPGESRPVRCANLNGSGTLVRSGVFERMGGLDERLFIDHVDTDWSFRVLDAGLVLFGIPNAVFDHSMGERGLRFWFIGWRVWPVRSPRRHYFLFRNSVKLMHRSHVPWVWKCWAVAKLSATLALHALFDARRGTQVRHMLRGLKDGLRANG
jgi:rhamnosyltransferase